MRETQFIEQNKAKWDRFERVLSSKTEKDPEELSNLFMEVTDDLSYSRTFYPNRSVRHYLNGIAQKVFYSIYKNRKGRFRRFSNFWSQDVPQIIYEARRELLFSLLFFGLAVLIGVFSTIMDADFPRVILGDAYVDMTFRNIERGEPMSVYQSADQNEMFFKIGFNNLYVSFLTFVMGLLSGVGTLYILLRNGIMLGAFQTLFIREGIYWDSILTIWIHGTIEISCIIIAGGAGLTLGKGLAFPGTYTRLQSLQLAARRGILIMTTLAPLIIFAAFLESFVTRYTDASYVARAAVILLSLGFVLGYFVFYPWYKARRGFTSGLRDANLPPTREPNLDFYRIKPVGEVFSDAFAVFRRHIAWFAGLSAALALVATTWLVMERYPFRFCTSNWILDALACVFENIPQILTVQDNFDALWWLNVAVTAVMSFAALWFTRRHSQETDQYRWRAYLYGGLSSLGVSMAVHWFLLAPGAFVVLLGVFVLPWFVYAQAVAFNERVNPFSAIGRMFSLLGASWTTVTGAFSVMLLMCGVFMIFATAPLVSLYFQVFSTFFPMEMATAANAETAFLLFINQWAMLFIVPLVYIAVSIAYFSARETQEANDLLRQIPNIGVHRTSYGMEREEETDED